MWCTEKHQKERPEVTETMVIQNIDSFVKKTHTHSATITRASQVVANALC